MLQVERLTSLRRARRHSRSLVEARPGEVEQVCSRVVILKDGRVVGHDSVANLRATLQLPSLDAVFAALVAEENVEERTRGLVAAMKA